MYAATPDVPKSRHLRLSTIALLFVPGASNMRTSLGYADKIRHPRDPSNRSKKPTAGHCRRLVPDLYLLCQCAQDRAAWTTFSVLDPGESREKCRKGEITRRMRKLSHFDGKTAREKRSHTYIHTLKTNAFRMPFMYSFRFSNRRVKPRYSNIVLF